MNRRDPFLIGRRAVLSGLAAGTIRQDVLFAQGESQGSPDALEQRIAEVMQAYDAQGNHRTGTEVDNASAEWLTLPFTRKRRGRIIRLSVRTLTI